MNREGRSRMSGVVPVLEVLTLIMVTQWAYGMSAAPAELAEARIGR